MSDRLSALDGTFLELEDANPAAHMHIGGIMVFGPPVCSAEEIRALLYPRLDALPRYRRKLAHPEAGRLTWQRWVEDADFDITRHVLAAELPPPGGSDQLLEWAGPYFSRRLERGRPLWEMVVVERLGGDRWAIVTKTHHCMVDGVGSVQAAQLLFDDEARGPAPAPAERDNGFPRPHPVELVKRVAALAELAVREEVLAVPQCSINGAIGPTRTLRAVELDHADARQVTRALGGKVNDVVLTGVCAGLRALLLARGEEPPRGLRAMVPINVRPGGDSGLGNHVSSLFVELPVHEANGIARYEHICDATAAAKGGSQPLGADTLLALGAHVPPVFHQIAARSLFAKRLFNLTVTNVPGPPAPLAVLGAPLESVYPLVPLAADHAVGIAVVSYGGRLMFGINADAESVPDVGVLADGIADGLALLRRVSDAALVGR